MHWAGYLWFILVSGLVWQGNRFAMLFHRRRYDCVRPPLAQGRAHLLRQPAHVAPLCVGMLSIWYVAAGVPVDREAVRIATLVIVIVALFIVHLYETVYLIQQREGDLVAVAHLEKARAVAELLALRSQIDPHFLFNGLNSLAYLIAREPARAVEFTERLSDVYRYILLNRERDLVPLAEELAFALRYVGLLRIRFGDAVRLFPAVDLDPEGLLVPPVSLQVLLENAVKHNTLDAAAPLRSTSKSRETSSGCRTPEGGPERPGPRRRSGSPTWTSVAVGSPAAASWSAPKTRSSRSSSPWSASGLRVDEAPKRGPDQRVRVTLASPRGASGSRPRARVRAWAQS